MDADLEMMTDLYKLGDRQENVIRETNMVSKLRPWTCDTEMLIMAFVARAACHSRLLMLMANVYQLAIVIG